MTFDGFVRLFPRLRCSKEVHYACEFLENRHLRFGVDFGISNAVRKATEICLEEIEEEEAYGSGV